MIIRRARLEELDELRAFYNTHWGRKHACINVKAFVDYYYVDGDYLNFVIAREAEDSDIISSCGYVLSNSTDNPDIWTALWLTKKGSYANVGLQIIDYMAKKMGFRLLATNNARPDTLILYKFLGYETAKMEHYYRLAPKDKYNVTVIRNPEILPYEITGYSLKLFSSPEELMAGFDAALLPENRPYKDLSYIIKRFYSFPFYSYLVYGIVDEQKHCRSLVVLRKTDVNHTSVLRVVDLLGKYDDFAKIGHCLQDLLTAFGSEFIEFYCYGLPPEVLAKAGFSVCGEENPNLIPSFLDPYAPISADYYLFCSNINDFVLFRADGDQDRQHIELIG